MASQMRQKHGTAAEWELANPVLANGELGWAQDTKVLKMGDGTTSWNNLTSPYLPANGKAADSELLDGLEAAAFLRAADTTIGRDRGAGNVWPTTDLRRGDVYWRTDVSQLAIYNGTFWRLVGPGTVATLAARDALGWGYDGLVIRVTADGSVWEMLTNLTWFQTNQDWFNIVDSGPSYSTAWPTPTNNVNLPGYSNVLYTIPPGKNLQVYWFAPAVLENANTNGGIVLVVNGVAVDAMTISTGSGAFIANPHLFGSYRNASASAVQIGISVYIYVTSGTVNVQGHPTIGPKLRGKLT